VKPVTLEILESVDTEAHPMVSRSEWQAVADELTNASLAARNRRQAVVSQITAERTSCETDVLIAAVRSGNRLLDRLDAVCQATPLSDCKLKLERRNSEFVSPPAHALEVRRGRRTEVDGIRVVHRRRDLRNPFDARAEERPTPPTRDPSIAGEDGFNERIG
jgi:hypothetical protein